MVKCQQVSENFNRKRRRTTQNTKTYPGAQSLHSPCPSWLLYMPIAHTWQEYDVWLLEYFPLGHSVQKELPFLTVPVPVAQNLHCCWFGTKAYWPKEQTSQFDWPMLLPNFPALQGAQFARPVSLDAWPTGQSWQVTACGSSAARNCPCLQWKHSSPYLPAMQFWQDACPTFSNVMVPTSHFLHVIALIWSEKVFSEHSWQVVWSYWSLKRPAVRSKPKNINKCVLLDRWWGG